MIYILKNKKCKFLFLLLVLSVILLSQTVLVWSQVRVMTCLIVLLGLLAVRVPKVQKTCNIPSPMILRKIHCNRQWWNQLEITVMVSRAKSKSKSKMIWLIKIRENETLPAAHYQIHLRKIINVTYRVLLLLLVARLLKDRS